MRIYTSYWSMVRSLAKAKVEPVSVSRGKPKGWAGRSFDCLAPTWQMLKMSDEDYDMAYADILANNNPHEFVRELQTGLREGCEAVALLCWEKDPKDCHRSMIARWLTANGYEVEEFDPKKPVDRPEQPALF